METQARRPWYHRVEKDSINFGRVPQSEPGNSNSCGTHVRDGDDQSIAGGALKLVHPLDEVLARDKLRAQLAHRFECLTSIRWNQLDNHDRDSFSTRSTHGSSR